MTFSSLPWTLNVLNGAGHVHDRHGRTIGMFPDARDAEFVVELANISHATAPEEYRMDSILSSVAENCDV